MSEEERKLLSEMCEKMDQVHSILTHVPKTTGNKKKDLDNKYKKLFIQDMIKNQTKRKTA